MSLVIALTDFLQLAYGSERDLLDRAFRIATRVLGRNVVETIADVRAVTMALDQQHFPTPILVRFSTADIRFAKINGIDCPVDRNDASVSVPAESSGSWEPHLVACFRKICRPGSVAFDIGANVGYHTLMLATLAGSEGACYAFEPNSENCRLILLGSERNNIANIRLMPIALSDEPGWAYFSMHIGSNGGFVTQHFVASQRHCSVVPVFTLDDLSLPDVDLIKVDVEGAEYKVLKGGEALLSRSRPAIVSEFSVEMTPRVSAVAPGHYLAWIQSMDYEIYVLDKQSNEPVSIDPVAEFLNRWGNFTRIEDLLFLPREKLDLIGDA